jgi:aryl-alcohol dehydrogenase-like predicted oxidoreductase
MDAVNLSSPHLLRGPLKYRSLGNSGLSVSELTLGTVELGLDYGFKNSDRYVRPEQQDAIRLIHRAVDLGINLIDTARAYGESEFLVGQALSSLSNARPYVASKVTVPDDAAAVRDSKIMRRMILESIEMSLKQLRIDAIDILQIHNTKPDTLRSGEVLEVLFEVQKKGMIRLIGASAFARGEVITLAIIEDGRIPVVQAPFNLLDQVLTRRVFPEAAKRGVGILIRSAFLRGVLTNQVHSIPERLAPLREAALNALRLMEAEVGSLSEAALRFCLSFGEVSSVIIGVRSLAELEENVAAANKGGLSPEVLASLRDVAIKDEDLIDTTQWKDVT